MPSHLHIAAVCLLLSPGLASCVLEPVRAAPSASAGSERPAEPETASKIADLEADVATAVAMPDTKAAIDKLGVARLELLRRRPFLDGAYHEQNPERV